MENKLKQQKYGISVKLWGNQTKFIKEIASKDNPYKKNLWILWRHVKIKNANRVT